jgi:hypothetical protein
LLVLVRVWIACPLPNCALFGGSCLDRLPSSQLRLVWRFVFGTLAPFPTAPCLEVRVWSACPLPNCSFLGTLYFDRLPLPTAMTLFGLVMKVNFSEKILTRPCKSENVISRH